MCQSRLVATSSVREEIEARCGHCHSDYATARRFPSKTLSAALFMFFATFFSTVALGAHVQVATGGRIGLTEYLLMNCVAGVGHALGGAQPLLVVRPTGPITAIITKLSAIADATGQELYSLLAATGLAVSVLMFAIAALQLSKHVRRFTSFTLEIFACFVCSICK